MDSAVKLGEISSVPYSVLTPPGYHQSGPLPLCLFLMGGGGSRQSLIDCQPLFESWWSDGSLAPMILATPSAGMSYYLDWESFIADHFLTQLRQELHAGSDRESTAIAGISMGGYGALKIAFARPDLFGAVAAIQPLLEPGFRDADVGPRNRLHHTAGGPAQLLGPDRDAALVEANNPANRARANAAEIRDRDLAIYLEVGDDDFINAHDGAEFLHRVLWGLDISHEYRLIRCGDHGGPTLVPRMRDAFRWVGSVLTESRSAESTELDGAVGIWIESGMIGAPPPVAPGSKEFLRVMRAQLQPLRERAVEMDANTKRRYGVLPVVS